MYFQLSFPRRPLFHIVYLAKQKAFLCLPPPTHPIPPLPPRPPSANAQPLSLSSRLMSERSPRLWICLYYKLRAKLVVTPWLLRKKTGGWSRKKKKKKSATWRSEWGGNREGGGEEEGVWRGRLGGVVRVRWWGGGGLWGLCALFSLKAPWKPQTHGTEFPLTVGGGGGGGPALQENTTLSVINTHTYTHKGNITGAYTHLEEEGSVWTRRANTQPHKRQQRKKGTWKEPAGQRLDMPAGLEKKTSETPYHLNTSQLYGKVDGPTFHGYWCGAGGMGGEGVLIQCTMCLTLTDRFPWNPPGLPLAAGPLLSSQIEDQRGAGI